MDTSVLIHLRKKIYTREVKAAKSDMRTRYLVNWVLPNLVVGLCYCILNG